MKKNYPWQAQTEDASLLGLALWDSFHGQPQPLITYCDRANPEEYKLSQFLNPYPKFSVTDKAAINLSVGKVLDIGAAAGRHTLAVTDRGLECIALEKDPVLCELMKLRGVKNVVQQDLFHFKAKEEFNTLLLLMNGIGLAGTINKIPDFLNLLKTWLKPDGKILVETSDISYLPPPPDGQHPDELIFQYVYNKQVGPEFNWVFPSARNLEKICSEINLKARQVIKTAEKKYLYELTLQ